MTDFLRNLWTETWWVYDPATTGAWGQAYRSFNLIEGCFWIGFAALVLWRWRKYDRSKLEVWYSLTFFLFGLTDFREAYVQSAPLVLAKGVLIVLLFWQRNLIIKKWYPHAWF